MFPIVPILATLGQAGFQAYQAHRQSQLAKELKPSNYVPPSLLQAEQGARLAANSLPVGYNRTLQQGDMQTAQTIESAKRLGGTPAQVQQSVMDADARQRELIKDTNVAAAGQQHQAQQDLVGILSDKARFEKMSNDAYNAAVSALKGASKQNAYNAITGAGQNLINIFGTMGKNGASEDEADKEGVASKEKFGDTTRNLQQAVPFQASKVAFDPGEANPYDPSGGYTPEQLAYIKKQFPFQTPTY